jgi:hypothetical protein
VVEIFDAASRLAQGRPAAETVQDYVWACHLVGYQNPDLTLHSSQVRDWYGSEDGIDLRALDADCEALRAAAAATEGVLARQEVQLVSMAVAWRGPGAQASREFLRRHGEASVAVVNAVRIAAESLVALRDRLWHSVDGKVGATIAAAGRGSRPDWRSAAQTVTTGAGDRATASELVDQEVRPFVDNDIRSEWLTAMRSAVAAVTDAYDAAAAELTSEVAIAFDVPGDLGPAWSPPPGDGAATAPAGASSVGAGPVGAAAPVGAPTPWSAPPSAEPFPPPLPPPSAQPVPPPWSAPPAAQPFPPPLPPPLPLPSAPPVEPAAMAAPSVPPLGGGMPDIGSGLSGYAGQLGDLLGGLMDTSQDQLSDLPEPDEPEPDEPEPEAVLDEEENEEGEAVETDVTEPDPATDVVGEPEPEEQPADELPPAPTEAPPPPMPAAPPPPPPEPMSAAGTPCAIAANELPQVGQ